MELEKKQIHLYQTGKKIVDQFLLDDDYNVPDTKNDVRRIIASEGKVKIEDVKLVENYVRITGKLYFQILYVTEGIEPALSSLNGKLPFEEMVYVSDAADGKFSVCDERVDFTATMIHSRKLSMKAVVELELCPGKVLSEEITTDVEGNVSLYKKKKALELLKLHTTKRDTYRIKEELTLPGTKEMVGNVLWTDISNRKLDTRLENDTLLLSGELLAFCFYESPEGKLDWIEQVLPYEGSVECYGVNPSMYHHMNTSLEDVNVDIRMDEDGEMRVLGIEGTLEMNIVIYEEEREEILEDVYSLERKCMLETEESCYEELLLQNNSKCKVAERLSIPELKDNILQICHSSATIQVEHTEIEAEGIRIEGVMHINFLYVKSNDNIPFDTWQGMIPFSHLIECGQAHEDIRYDIASTLEQLNVASLGGDSVEIKAIIAFNSFIRKTVCMEGITNLTAEKIPEEEMVNRPGIVGYVVKEGDGLWTLAKRFYTTVEGIQEVNELKDEKIKPGDKLLIFKENMSIL